MTGESRKGRALLACVLAIYCLWCGWAADCAHCIVCDAHGTTARLSTAAIVAAAASARCP